MVGLTVGTYEGNLIGWESDVSADASGRTLALAYAFNAHEGSIRALALDGESGTTLVTASSDETMKLYNLRSRREVGSLMEHTDAVATMAFFGGDCLLSADRGGTICIWRASDWTCLHSMKGHKYVGLPSPWRLQGDGLCSAAL
jgi:protein MAK11